MVDMKAALAKAQISINRAQNNGIVKFSKFKSEVKTEAAQNVLSMGISSICGITAKHLFM